MALIRKMVHYSQDSILADISNPENSTFNFAVQLVEVIAEVLDNEVCNSQPFIFFVFCLFNIKYL